jgi:hypothetical protein
MHKASLHLRYNPCSESTLARTSVSLTQLLSLLLLAVSALLLCHYTTKQTAVRPLEKMVKKVRAGNSVDINKLEALSVRRYYSIFIAAIGFFSLLVGAWLQRTASDNIMHAVSARAEIGPGNVDLAWRYAVCMHACI